MTDAIPMGAQPSNVIPLPRTHEQLRKVHTAGIDALEFHAMAFRKQLDLLSPDQARSLGSELFSLMMTLAMLSDQTIALTSGGLLKGGFMMQLVEVEGRMKRLFAPTN